jgi:hypothetical protein
MTVAAIIGLTLGQRVLPVDSDSMRELSQRRRVAPLGGEQVPDHRADEGLMPDPV